MRSKISTCRRELAPCLAGKGSARQESENRSRKEILKRQIEVRYKESRTANLGLELKNKIFFSPPLFVSFPQKRNGIVFSSGVNYLLSGGNIQSE